MSLLTALAAVIAACASGCGGGDEGAGAAPTPESSHSAPKTEVKTISVSRAKYIALANRVCARSWPRMRDSYARRYGSKLGPDATEAELFAEASKNIFLPSLQMQFDDIKYIGARRDEKPQVEAILRELQLAVYRGQDREAIPSPERFVTIFSEFNRLAGEYGLDRCLVGATRFD